MLKNHWQGRPARTRPAPTTSAHGAGDLLGELARHATHVVAQHVQGPTPSDVAATVAAERAAQGLPPTVTDPAALARVAALLTARRP